MKKITWFEIVSFTLYASLFGYNYFLSNTNDMILFGFFGLAFFIRLTLKEFLDK